MCLRSFNSFVGRSSTAHHANVSVPLSRTHCTPHRAQGPEPKWNQPTDRPLCGGEWMREWDACTRNAHTCFEHVTCKRFLPDSRPERVNVRCRLCLGMCCCWFAYRYSNSYWWCRLTRAIIIEPWMYLYSIRQERIIPYSIYRPFHIQFV